MTEVTKPIDSLIDSRRARGAATDELVERIRTNTRLGLATLLDGDLYSLTNRLRLRLYLKHGGLHLRTRSEYSNGEKITYAWVAEDMPE